MASIFGEDDDWSLSMEELDSIERSAAQQLAARRTAGSPLVRRPELLARTLDGTAPVVPVTRSLEVRFSKDDGKINVFSQYDKGLVAAYKTVAGHEWDPSRKLWSFPESRLQELVTAIVQLPNLDLYIEPVAPLIFPPAVSEMICGKMVASSPAKSPLPSPVKPQEMPRTPTKPLLVKLYLREDGRIAAQNLFHEGARQAFQTVQGRSWNNEDRIWTFPRTSLLDLVCALQQRSEIKIELVPPLEVPCDAHVKCSPGAKPSTPIAVDGDYPCSLPGAGTGGTPSKEKPRVQLFLHSSGVLAVRSSSSMSLMTVLKSIPKAFWNHKERLWMFPPSSLPDAESRLSSVSVVEPLPPIVERALEYSCRLQNLSDKYAMIPSYLEESLLPFQRDGVRFVLQHGGRALVADEMGLGKTVQAIAIASCFREEWPVLVVVPSSLRIQWAVMLKTWLRLSPSDITVVLSQGSAARREGFKIVHSAGRASLELTGAFNIISYDMVAKLQGHANFKVVIADESHYMKNAQAKRTSACVPLIQKARHAVLLSGTPALSRPIELFKQLEALQPNVYVDVHEYGQRYCSGGLFGLHQGSSNRDELHALLKSTVMIRRLKREVLTELPGKFRQQLFLSLDSTSTKQLRALFQELRKLRDDVQGSLEGGIEKLKAEEKILITKIYSESAVAKLAAVQEYLSTIVEADCKFLVFAHHQYMMDGIEEHFKKKKTGYIRIDGGTPAAARQNLITSFQQSEGVKAALLSIRAAGVGLTLTAASTVVFAELSWTPGDLVQAEDRAHRLGQKSSVNIYYLHAQDTIDDLIWESVKHKLENLGQVLNGKEERLNVVPSPPAQRQRLLTDYLRPCGASEESSSDQGLQTTSKRCRLFFE